MSDRIARHHELESMETREEILIHIARPHTRLTTHLGIDISDNLIKKCPSSCGRIEDLDTMCLDHFRFSLSFFIVFLDISLDLDLARISESLREMKVRLQNIIDRSYNELHHRSRRIENSPLHTEVTIIFTEEILIEMNHWIMRLLLIDSVHELLHFCMRKYPTELIDDIFETLLITFSCDMIEESAQEGIRFRDEVTSF